MRTGPQEWTPSLVSRILKKLESRTVDTGKAWIEETKVIGAANVQPDNTLQSWHVTDDPSVVLRILASGIDLQAYRAGGDLCGGLYVSAYPQIWKSRSRKKWDFMNTLSPQGTHRLAQAILQKLDLDYSNRRITQNEYERGVRDVEHYWLKLGNWQVLLSLASLPYALDIQELARTTGVADPFNPETVDVLFEGRYLHLVDEVRELSKELAAGYLKKSLEELGEDDLCQAWRMLGWDGVFTKASMGTNPELVIWNRDRILKFGSWARGA